MSAERLTGRFQRRRSARPEAERGSALVEYIAVAAFASLLFCALIQVALAIHVRNTAVSIAQEAGRFAALEGNTNDDGAARAYALAAQEHLSGNIAAVEVSAVPTDSGELITVTVRGQLPVVGLAGPSQSLEVQGHGFREAP